MSNTQIVTIDTIRTLGFASISGSYSPVGGALTQPVRLICFTNNTDGDMFFSDDGINNKIFVASSSFKLFDLTENRRMSDQFWVFQIGTQFYVKQSTAPSKNAVFIECLWGQ